MVAFINSSIISKKIRNEVDQRIILCRKVMHPGSTKHMRYHAFQKLNMNEIVYVYMDYSRNINTLHSIAKIEHAKGAVKYLSKKIRKLEKEIFKYSREELDYGMASNDNFDSLLSESESDNESDDESDNESEYDGERSFCGMAGEMICNYQTKWRETWQSAMFSPALVNVMAARLTIASLLHLGGKQFELASSGVQINDNVFHYNLTPLKRSEALMNEKLYIQAAEYIRRKYPITIPE